MAKKKRTGKSGKAPTKPTPKPWDVPERPARGDASQDTTYTAVGRALTAWESLEECIAHIFETIVSPRDESLAALRAYGSVLAFKGRGEMIKAAADAAFFLSPEDDLHNDLKKLINEIGRFSARRNEFAHGKVHPLVPSTLLPPPEWARQVLKAGYILGPPEYATNKTSLKEGRSLLEITHRAPSYAYSSVEIAVFQSHFERLAEEARNLSIRLHQHLARQTRT